MVGAKWESARRAWAVACALGFAAGCLLCSPVAMLIAEDQQSTVDNPLLRELLPWGSLVFAFTTSFAIAFGIYLAGLWVAKSRREAGGNAGE